MSEEEKKNQTLEENQDKKIEQKEESKEENTSNETETTSPQKEEKSKEEFEFDFSKFKNLFSNKRLLSVLLIIVLLAIPMFYSIDYRMRSADLPIAEAWARDNINNNLQAQFRSQVLQETPHLAPASVDREVDRRLQAFIESNEEEYQNSIRGSAEGIRQRLKNDEGTTYLLAIDPWYYYRQAENILERGHTGDEERNGKPWDNHVMAPLGGEAPDHFHPNFAVLLYNRFGKIFDLSLFATFFLLPVILITFAVIPAFFIGRKISGNLGGFFAAMIIAVNGALLARTPAGFSDTDSYVIMFPLLVTWVFLEAYDSKSWLWRILLSSLAGLLVGLFSFAWSGWWYVFNIIVASMVAYVVYAYLINIRRKNVDANLSAKKVAVLLFFFFLFAVISFSFFFSPQQFVSAVTAPLGFTQIKEVAQTTVWPNVYTTVAELNVIPMNAVIAQVASSGRLSAIFFVFALLGGMLCFTGRKFSKFDYVAFAISILYYFILIRVSPEGLIFLALLAIPPAAFVGYHLYKQTTGENVKFGFLIMLWFAVSLYATTKGVRFTLIIVPVFALGFGIFVGKFYNHISTWIIDKTKIKKAIVVPILVLLFLTLLISPVQTGRDVANREFPTMNDGWYEALKYIEDNSQEDAIIHSWWDFGHWFKAIADRAVTFDGGSQNTPMAHWTGNAFLTSNEKESVGILRMLDCGSNNAYDLINSELKDIVKSVDLIYKIIVEEKASAKTILLDQGISESKADEILEYTHCNPPEAFVIASEDMVGKAGVWGHFGSWDFERAYLYQSVKDLRRTEGIDFIVNYKNYSEERAELLYDEIRNADANQWISPWPSYSMANQRSCSPGENNTVVCPFNTIVEQNSQVQAILREFRADLDNINNSKIIVETINLATNERLGYNQLTPQKVTILLRDEYESYDLPNSTITLGVLLSMTGGEIKAMYSDSLLTDAMFTKMFYNEGQGLEYFDLVEHKVDVFNQDIYVFKVDWEGRDKQITYTEQEYLATHVLICGAGDSRCDKDRTPEEARELAENIRQQATSENIKDLAIEYSDDPSGQINSGNLGWQKVDIYVPEFQEALKSLEIGEISDLVKTEFGYHIIYLEDKR